MANIQKCLFVLVLFAILQVAIQEHRGDGWTESKGAEQAVREAPARPALGAIINQLLSEGRNGQRSGYYSNQGDAQGYANTIDCAALCGWSSGSGHSANCNNDNSGNGNSGSGNSGTGNSGNCNSGNDNSGSGNTGNGNSGNCNSGNDNSGHCNTGDGNSGDCNSGVGNSGNCNSADGQSGNGHSGSCSFCH